MTGQLFTHYFLTDGIRATTEWPASESYCAGFRRSLAGIYRDFARYRQPNEAVTEQDLIRPALDLLGWTDYLPQQGADRNQDIPDHLLFTDRRIQDPRRRQVRSKGPLPARLSRRGEQTLRPAPRCQEQRRPGPGQHTPRPDPPLPFDRRYRVRRQHSLGHPDKRQTLAPLRPSLPATRQWLLRGRPPSDTRYGR